MALLRMVLIEAEMGEHSVIADVIRLAMLGNADAIQGKIAAAAPLAVPVEPAKATNGTTAAAPVAPAPPVEKKNGIPKRNAAPPEPMTPAPAPAPAPSGSLSAGYARLISLLSAGPKTPVELSKIT